MAMLSAEIRGEPYSKTEHRRALLPLLDGRSEGAIERKHGNISAVLIELGHPYIEGYKPFANYQQLLFDVVAARVAEATELEQLVAADVEAVVTPPTVDDILASLVEPPELRPRAERIDQVGEPGPFDYRVKAKRAPIDYLRREASNASLGAAGELFALEFERARLIAARKERLASRIEHVSKTRGDGDGFDILSFEESGREKLIEVKTTRYGKQTPFYVSSNEVAVSEREAAHYHLYRVFGFRKRPKLFEVQGAFTDRFSLNPTQFLARLT